VLYCIASWRIIARPVSCWMVLLWRYRQLPLRINDKSLSEFGSCRVSAFGWRSAKHR